MVTATKPILTYILAVMATASAFNSTSAPKKLKGLKVDMNKSEGGLSGYFHQNLQGTTQLRQDLSIHNKDEEKTMPSATNEVNPLIVGGIKASPGEYPWFAGSTGDIICGASLIAPDILVSAAHCEEAFDNGAVVGAYYFDSTEFSAERRDVVQKQVHSGYVGGSFADGNDIMVMKLSSPVSMSPVPLNLDTNDPVNGESLVTMGFGLTSFDGQASIILMEAEVLEVSTAQCQTSYNRLPLPPTIDEDIMICAYNDDQDKSACNGDSGGPLIDSAGALIGVVSFGVQCGEEDFPPVYTRISGYADWLEREICELSDDPPFDCDGSNPSTTSAPASTDFDTACTGLGSFLYGSNTNADCYCDQVNQRVICSNVLPLDCSQGSCLKTDHYWLFTDNGDYDQLDTCVSCVSGYCSDYVDRCYLVGYFGEDEPSACGIQRLDTGELCTDCFICDGTVDFGVQYTGCFGLTTPCSGDGTIISNPFDQRSRRRNLRRSRLQRHFLSSIEAAGEGQYD